MEKEKMEEKQLKKALYRVATGYSVEEVTEEYGVEDGELKLLRRKEVRKEIPPDLKAVKLLLEGESIDCRSLTDEQLEAEKQRLLKELKEKENEERSARKEVGTALRMK